MKVVLMLAMRFKKLNRNRILRPIFLFDTFMENYEYF